MEEPDRAADEAAIVPRSARNLARYGWDETWAARLAEHPGTTPGRVTRHDGTALQLATESGIVTAVLARRLDPAPTVGDWIACAGDEPVAVLRRTSLLRRRAGDRETDQVLAANVDTVLLVCGLDRPVKPGRINRSATLARDAGATPVVVLTKAALDPDAASVARDVQAACDGIEVLVTSAQEGLGLDALRDLARGRTVTMLGESGAGKSSLVNALLGEDVAPIADVRRGDAKGRHTTTTRDLHVLPGSGVLIDTPGIRGVGLWVEPEVVAETFTDIDELAASCRFGDCSHDTEPGCAVTAAVEEGTLTAARVQAWRALDAEARAGGRAATTYEQRRRDRELSRMIKGAKRRKERP